MCHHTRDPTVLSRVSRHPRLWVLTVFTSLACYPGAPLLPPKQGWLGQGQVRTVVPAPRGDHLPLRAARFFLLATHWRYCHADWTVPRQDVNSSFLPHVCHPEKNKKGDRTHAGSGPLRARRLLLVACLGDSIPLATTSLLIQVRRMTIVLLQNSSRREKRVEHLTRFLFYCLFPMRCR